MHKTRLPSTRCDGLNRRDFLHLGVVSCLGLSLADLLRLQSAHAAAAPVSPIPRMSVSRTRFCLDAGPSPLVTFDPKPDAPAEVRGDFDPIPTSVDGIRICEHLPRTAQMMRAVALVRSLTHELGNHD